ncbi:MAG: BtpA/SgcQ family protein [Acidimicrobiia bacterium]|jgi:hypothetical protein
MNRLIGVVHLPPLPGAPRYSGDLSLEGAVRDAGELEHAGFDSLIVENFGDVPFYPDDVPATTVAAMTRAVLAIKEKVSIPVGLNVLRNDGLAALGIAAAVGASFIRVNVYTGTMTTDQGVISGRAAEITRLRAQLGAEVAIYADVLVKHAVPPPGVTMEQAVADAVGRGLADAVIVTGSATGAPADRDMLRRAAASAGSAPVLVGSGANEENISGLLEVAQGVIVGTSLKLDGVTTNPVDPARAAAFVKAAG